MEELNLERMLMTLKASVGSKIRSNGQPSSGLTNQTTVSFSPRFWANIRAEFMDLMRLHKPPTGCIINISVSFLSELFIPVLLTKEKIKNFLEIKNCLKSGITTDIDTIIADFANLRNGKSRNK